MKNLDLSVCGVQESGHTEIRKTKVGWILPFVAGVILGVILCDLINNFDEVCAAFNAGCAAARELLS